MCQYLHYIHFFKQAKEILQGLKDRQFSLKNYMLQKNHQSCPRLSQIFIKEHLLLTLMMWSYTYEYSGHILFLFVFSPKFSPQPPLIQITRF